MKRFLRLSVVLSCLLVSPLFHDGVGAIPCDRVVGVNNPDGGAALVKHFSVPGGKTITGLEFISNDPQTLFPRVVLLRGSADRVSGATIVEEFVGVRAPDRHRVQLGSINVQVPWTTDFYVAVLLPPSSGLQRMREGVGLGGMQRQEPGGGNYIASALDGEFQAIDVDLAIRLIFEEASKADIGETTRPGSSDRTVQTYLGGISNADAGTMRIEFGLAESVPVTISVYDVAGRLVRRLTSDAVSPGTHSWIWEGRDGRGQAVAQGVYIFKLQAGATVMTRKAVMIR